MFIRKKKSISFLFLEAVFTVRRTKRMHGWKGFIYMSRSIMFQHVLNISNTLCLYVFGECVCVCVCARVFVCAWPLPCKVHVPVCVRTRFFVTILRVCASEGACVFNNAVECVVHFQRTNSGIQFDRCENLSKKCIYRRWGKKKKKEDFTVVVKPLFLSIYYPITNLLSVYT